MEEDCFLADERGELQKDVPDWKKIWQYSLEKGEKRWRERFIEGLPAKTVLVQHMRSHFLI